MRGLLFLLILMAPFSYSSVTGGASFFTCQIKLSQVKAPHTKKIFYFNGNVSREGYESSSAARYLFSQIVNFKPQLCDPRISGNTTSLDNFFLSHLKVNGMYIGTIFFDTGIDAISSSDNIRLRQLLKTESYQGIIFIGRADSTGESRFNQDLSYRRATNAQKILSKDAASVIIALGDRQTPQEKADLRRNNRRVDIYGFAYPDANSR